VTSSWLPRALELSRARGFFGPGPLSAQVSHAEGFVACWEALAAAPPRRLLDLGTGGGLPGFVLVDRWGCPTVLLDSMAKKADYLREVLAWPDAPSGVLVVAERAELAARRADLEATFTLVTARSFARPAVTAECAARFLEIGGYLIVSEPPEDLGASRWPPEGLAQLGLKALGRRRHGAAFQVLVKESATDPTYPRPIGIPGKRPLF